MQECQVLGLFPDAITAAKAHDIALIHRCGPELDETQLNFPKKGYDGTAAAVIQKATAHEFQTDLQRCGKVGYRRNSR